MERKGFRVVASWVSATVEVVRETVTRAEGIAQIALAGGGTPTSHYAALGQSELPFERIELWQVDERFVPRTDPHSNAGMIERTLGATCLTRLHAWHAIDTSCTIRATCDSYERLLHARHSPFDLTILGIGLDGHIASLFPGSSALSEMEALVVPTVTERLDICERVTLTLPSILASRTVLLLAGPEKGAVVHELLSGGQPTRIFPAASLREHRDVRLHVLDAQ